MKSLVKKIKKYIIICIVLFAIVSAYFVFDGYKMYENAIKSISIEKKVKQMRTDEDFVKLEDVSKDFVNGIVTIEDRRFYEHFGIDIYSMIRATISNFKAKEIESGASTITQQLAKNMYFTQEKKISRKIAEIFVALDMEENYSKDEILELYINCIYFGDGYYGIKEASLGCFNKLPSELNLNEATILAGIPNAPSVYAYSNNSPKTYQRQKMVLRALLDSGYLTAERLESENIKL